MWNIFIILVCQLLFVPFSLSIFEEQAGERDWLIEGIGALKKSLYWVCMLQNI